MTEYPFVYLNHGPLSPDSFGKVDTAWIAFARPATEEDVEYAVRTCPEPLEGFVTADESIVAFETGGDVYDFIVANEYGNPGETYVSEEAAAAFSAAVERWFTGVHERVPIEFAIGPGYPDCVMSDWAAWSKRRIPTTIVPWLGRYLDEHPDEHADVSADGESEDLFRTAPMTREQLSFIFQYIDCDEDADDEETGETSDLEPVAAEEAAAMLEALRVRLGWRE